MAALAKQHDCPLCVTAPDLDKLSALVEKVAAVTKDIIIGTTAGEPVRKLADLTQIRRQAIRKKIRPLGYPSIVSVCGKPALEQAAEASMYVAKYGSIILMDTAEKAHILPLCALRQNLFSDPQKPAQVEPGIFPIGEPDENSPVFCTTNFSLTYYTVEGEISGSKLPAWLIATPTDGTSVLTAWAAGKFVADKIAEFMQEIDLNDKIKHRNVVIPGYVAVLRAPLEEKSGWKVMVGPNEAAGIPTYIKANFS
jgi:acetyl-CoA decarbonylase/synthase complex subunit gamma